MKTEDQYPKGPPHWLDAFLEKVCASDLLEEVMGDLHERYFRQAKIKGERLARRRYFREVLAYLPSIIKRSKSGHQPQNHRDMLKNYLKIAWRNLLIHRMYSAINITGLAVGLACGILLLLWISHEVSYDHFNERLSRIRLIMKNETLSGEVFTGTSTPAPLKYKLDESIPEIEYSARTTGNSDHLFNIGDKSNYISGIYADPELFNIFSFQAISGDAVAAMRNPSSVIITREAALKLFGEENVLGKSIRMDGSQEMEVGAILEDIPAASTLQFEVVLPFHILEDRQQLKWDNNSFQNWILTSTASDAVELESKLAAIDEPRQSGEMISYFSYPLGQIHLYGNFNNGKPDGGSINRVRVLAAIGIFILLIGCINFMNLATARSERRAREVGVRKVMGAARTLIVGQFLSEALVMTFFGLVLSLLLVILFLPGFNLLTDHRFILDLSNWRHWTGILGLGLLTGLISGSYPAFYLSKFQPVRVLKGVIRTGTGAARLRRILVTFQFFISVVFIISTIVLHRQLDYVLQRPIGYDQTNLMDIPIRGELNKKMDVVKNELLRLPGVEHVSASNSDLLRMNAGLTGLSWPGKNENEDFPVTATWVSYDWANTAGFTIVEGRDFNESMGGDTLACLLNETAVRRMKLQEPLGAKIGNSYVIGVIKDFVYNDPTDNPEPLVIFFRKSALSHLLIRFANDGNWQQRLASIQDIIHTYNPEYPFEYHFTNEEYQKSFDRIRNAGQLITIFSGLAIFIACLGLIGLTSFVAERRRKELGIRKVLGATVRQLSLALGGDFLRPVLIALLLACPLTGFLTSKFLQKVAYHIELSWTIFVIAGSIVIGLSLLTIGFQSIRSARANPIESLREE